LEATLVFVSADGQTQEVPLSPRRYVIGRQTDCQLRVPERAVSREHAELVFDGDSLMIRDLGSSNGTYLNKHRIDQKLLEAGDVLGIGSVAIVVKIDGSPPVIDAEAARASAVPSEPPGAGTPISQPGARDDEDDELLNDLIGDPDDSSMADFDFDFSDDDEEDDQPAL